MSIKIFCVDGQLDYLAPFTGRVEYEVVDNAEDADVLWFTGGVDVDPSFYGEAPHPRTYSNYQRTYMEDQVLRTYPEKFKIGTCRGHQQFNVFDGGKLIQHLNYHGGQTHGVIDFDGNELFQVNSAHHQAILPSQNCEVLLYSVPRATVKQGIGVDGSVLDYPDAPEVEAAWWPNMNAFGVQFHPEWMNGNEPALAWFISTFNALYSKHLEKQ